MAEPRQSQDGRSRAREAECATAGHVWERRAEHEEIEDLNVGIDVCERCERVVLWSVDFRPLHALEVLAREAPLQGK